MKIFETFEDDHKFYIVVEFMEGDSLLAYISKQAQSVFTEKLVAGIIKQLLTGLNHCHSHGIGHRDIKPDNIMFADKENKTIKLVDFGFAKMFDPAESKLQELLGSPLSMAPEICQKKPYDLKCDIWSCGIICYILLTGEIPYLIEEGSSLPSLFEQIKKKSFSMADFEGGSWAGISVEAKHFVLAMLEKEPEKRASASQMLTMPWLIMAKDTQDKTAENQKCLSNPVKNCVKIYKEKGYRESKDSSMRS